MIALIAPIIIAAAFQVGFHYARPRRVWPIAIVLILIGSAIMVWVDRHGFTPQSPYSFALLVIVPALAAGGVAQLGTATRWPWPVTTIVASLAAICLVIPTWFSACLLAEVLHMSGCHF